MDLHEMKEKTKLNGEKHDFQNQIMSKEEK